MVHLVPLLLSTARMSRYILKGIRAGGENIRGWNWRRASSSTVNRSKNQFCMVYSFPSAPTLHCALRHEKSARLSILPNSIQYPSCLFVMDAVPAGQYYTLLITNSCLRRQKPFGLLQSRRGNHFPLSEPCRELLRKLLRRIPWKIH
jgi:hypothetical protein